MVKVLNANQLIHKEEIIKQRKSLGYISYTIEDIKK